MHLLWWTGCLCSVWSCSVDHFFSFCLSSHFLALQEVCPEDIPIMLVGNKCDLRRDGVNSVPTSYGEKLAMVMLMLTLTSFPFIPAFSHLSSNLFMVCFVLVFIPDRRTTHCSVKPAPRTAPTPWKLCCTWPGEATRWKPEPSFRQWNAFTWAL